MNNDTIFLYIIAAIALCFGLINCILFLLKRNRTAQTTGTIISIKMPNPETAKARNSKWAKVSYTVNGKFNSCYLYFGGCIQTNIRYGDYAKQIRHRGNVRYNTTQGCKRLVKLLEADKLGSCPIDSVKLSDEKEWALRMKEKGKSKRL